MIFTEAFFYLCMHILVYDSPCVLYIVSYKIFVNVLYKNEEKTEN